MVSEQSALGPGANDALAAVSVHRPANTARRRNRALCSSFRRP